MVIGNNSMNAVELFAGAGGLSIGLARVGFNIVLANEIEPDFAKTLAGNHPDTKVICADIHNVDFDRELESLGINSVALVSGGPPCQGFSTVGSKNKKDPRNSLFYEYLRAVSCIQPMYTLFENVSGFMRMYNGVAYQRLIAELDSMGYQTASGILEASDFGLPQKRMRTIVVGWKKSLPPVSFPQPTHWGCQASFGGELKLSVMDAISDLPPIGAGESSDRYLTSPRNDYQRLLRGNCKVLTEHNVANYGEKMQEILQLIPCGGTVNDLPERLRPKSYFGNTYARLMPDVPCPTVTRNFGTPSSSRCVHPYQNRALSTREGARLQGFPDSYVFTGAKGSKNLQIGNAVPPIFGEVIAKEIVRSMNASHQSVHKLKRHLHD
jgi:DNA (cytosine-5)-methyltransferase 1